MTLDPQTIVVGVVVGVAAGYLGRQAWSTLIKRSGGGCGSCASCPAETTEPSTGLVQLGKLEPATKNSTSVGEANHHGS